MEYSKSERQNYLPRIFFQPRILYPTKLPSKMKEKLRQTQISNFEEPASTQEVLKGVLQADRKGYQMVLITQIQRKK